MKKLAGKCMAALLIVLSCLPMTASEAFLGGGALKGPIAVYNKNTSVDAATLATQINTLKQLEAALKNLSSMDTGAATANASLIQQNLAQIAEVQQQIQGLVMDYTNFQAAWDSQYHDFGAYAGMSGAEYAQNATNLLNALNNSIYDAMRSQGLVSQIGSSSAVLSSLVDASRNSEGALAAAQVGSQIAGLQVQELMKLQQIISQSERAQTEWLAYQAHKEAMAQEAINSALSRENP